VPELIVVTDNLILAAPEGPGLLDGAQRRIMYVVFQVGDLESAVPDAVRVSDGG